jgi:prevent-host-death family protein
MASERPRSHDGAGGESTLEAYGLPVSLRDRRGVAVRAASYSATEAKNEFGRVLDAAVQGEYVVITKHEAPKAVLIAFEELQALVAAATRPLHTLRGEFDELLARMQTPAARAGLQAAFEATPEELGRAARGAARRRK